MYVEDLIKDFYNLLNGNRVLLLVNIDVDAICACKVLQALFKCDNIAYTVLPVRGPTELRTTYDENCEEIKHVVLVNCGATLDVVELLQPAEEVVFFIVDSRKPADVCNVYSNGQVRLLVRDGDEGVPAFDDIFRDDEDDDEQSSEEDNEEGGTTDRTERMRRAAERRRDLRLWKENRNKLMFDYTQFTYYSRSSAIRMFELAWMLSKDDIELLWWAIVGVTEQLTLDKVELPQYALETGTLQSHAARLHNKYDRPDHAGAHITMEKDARLALHRHWSAEASLRHSPYTHARLRLWTLRGQQRLQQLLADMGLPLAQARRAFSSMDLALRREFLPALERLASKYDLPDIVFLSFGLRHGYTHNFSASDVVYALLAILENETDGFQVALDALSRCHSTVLRRGITMAQSALKGSARLVQSTLEGHLLSSAGPFLYVSLPEARGPAWLGLVARWLQRCRRTALPLLAVTPAPSLLLGLAPLPDPTRNLFGKAFEQAALKSEAEVSQEYFDTSAVSLPPEQLSKFLDALTSLLT